MPATRCLPNGRSPQSAAVGEADWEERLVGEQLISVSGDDVKKASTI